MKKKNPLVQYYPNCTSSIEISRAADPILRQARSRQPETIEVQYHNKEITPQNKRDCAVQSSTIYDAF